MVFKRGPMLQRWRPAEERSRGAGREGPAAAPHVDEHPDADEPRHRGNARWTSWRRHLPRRSR